MLPHARSEYDYLICAHPRRRRCSKIANFRPLPDRVLVRTIPLVLNVYAQAPINGLVLPGMKVIAVKACRAHWR
jgi:hypothetical protein